MDIRHDNYNDSLIEEVVGLLNTGGGNVYLNYLNDEDSENLANDLSMIAPEVKGLIDCEQFADGMFMIKVARGSERPYFLADKGMEKSSYYFNDDYCELMNERQLDEYDYGDYESWRYRGSKLSFKAWLDELDSRNLKCSEEELKAFGLLGTDGLYTNLAYWLSDQCFLITRLISEKGNLEFKGSILSQYHDIITYLSYIEEERLSAIKEALLNAYLHYDYRYKGSVIVRIDDVVDVVSLGGVVEGLDEKAISLGAVYCRNPRLMALFKRLKYASNCGNGLKIISKYGYYEAAKGVFVAHINLKDKKVYREVAINSSKSENKLVDEEKETIIINYLKENEEINRQKAQDLLSLAKTATYQCLQQMVEEGKIIRSGKGKNVVYKLGL